MAVGPYALTTLATVKLQLEIAGTNYDTLLERYIDSVTARFETMTDRLLKQRTITEYQDGRNNASTLLDQWPAEKPTEFWVDSTGLFTDSDRQLAVADYELELSGRGEGVGVTLINKCRIGRGRRNVKIVYLGGYATIPADLEDAAIWAVEFMYDMRSDRRIGTESKGKNQETTRFLENFPSFITDVTDKYRRTEFPTGNLAIEAR